MEVNSITANCKALYAREAVARANFDLAEDLLSEAGMLEVDAYSREQVNLARIELQLARPTHDATSANSAPSRGRPAWAWATFGTGVGLVAAGIVYHLVASTSTFPNFRDAEADADPQRYARLSRRAATARWLIPTVYATGAATAFVGGFFLFIQPRREGATAGLSMRF